MSLLSAPTPAEREYRETQRDYSRAMRLLRKSPLKRIEVRNQAREEGISTDTIQRADERPEFVQGRERVFQTRSDEAARQAQMNRQFADEATRPQGLGGDIGGNVPTGDVAGGMTGEATAPETFKTDLGKFAEKASARRFEAQDGFKETASGKEADLKFRQGLDRALGQAKTKAETDELRKVALDAGVEPEAFDRRKEWWKNR